MIIEDKEVNKILTYLVCAKEFHFTPNQVDCIDNSLLEGILIGLSRIKERENQEK